MFRPIAPLLLLAGIACHPVSTPVPVSGQVEILAGEWAGSYEALAVRRSGSIVFRLKAGTDSAWGDVAMVVDPRWRLDPADERSPAMSHSQAIAIAFVACLDGEISGVMEPYTDPESGERISTTFTGRLVHADEIQGTFSAHYVDSRRRIGGTWSVKRRKAAEE